MIAGTIRELRDRPPGGRVAVDECEISCRTGRAADVLGENSKKGG